MFPEKDTVPITFISVLRIQDVYPGSRTSDPGPRIPDPTTATKEKGGKKFVARKIPQN
jgi:hypothetical protein